MIARHPRAGRTTAIIFELIGFLLCTAVDPERFDLRLWSKYYHVFLDVLQMPYDRRLFYARGCIDSKDHIACFRSDLSALIWTIQDARNDADLIADHHIAGF
jgi:hypothetical protein